MVLYPEDVSREASAGYHEVVHMIGGNALGHGSERTGAQEPWEAVPHWSSVEEVAA